MRWFLGPIGLAALISVSGIVPASAQDAQGTVDPTRALYRYERDDSATVTQIHINARNVGAVAESQGVFGNFIEHLGDVVYSVLWANALENPNLERTSADQHEPPYWDQTGAAQWVEDSTGYLSKAFERLSAPDGLVGERTYLPIYRTPRYTVTFYARGMGRVSATLHEGDDAAGRVLATQSIVLNSGGWQKQTVHWNLTGSGLVSGQIVRFVLANAGGGPVDVDQVQLVPDDAVDGMDPEVLKLAKDWDIPVMRLAGNFSSGYHWRDGVGPPLARPTLKNPAWPGIESNQFGTDEFLDLCRITGSTAQIAANAGNGTAQEAADWVRYCNSVKERVPIWEIGNELYGGWQIGHTDAAGYASRFVEFRDAMLAADPKIRIIANGKGDEFTNDGLDRNRVWNLDLLNAAKANNGQMPDWLSIHPLVALPGGLGDLSYADEWNMAMSNPEFMDQTEIPQLIDQIVSVEGPKARTKIAPTEWGIIIGGDRWADGPNHNAESGAIFAALTLNAFLRHGDWVTLANTTALLHGGCIAKSHGKPYVMPQYYVNKLYALTNPKIPVETTTRGPGSDVAQHNNFPAVQNIPNVDVFSALAAGNKRLVTFAVNRCLNESQRVKIDLSGFKIAKASAVILTSIDPQAGNTWNNPDNVKPTAFALPVAVPNRALVFTLPAHSLVVLTFDRQPAH